MTEPFRDNLRIAVHRRVLNPALTDPRQTTVQDHRPLSHQQSGDHSAQALLQRAESLGRGTVQMIEGLLAAGRHPDQGLRAALGLFKLAQAYGNARLEAACCRAVALQAFSYRSVESILKHHLDELALSPEEATPRVADHANVRGPAYYHHTDTALERTQHPLVRPDADVDPTLN